MCDKLPQSVLDVQLFWKTTAYRIGGHVFSLDDIEHGILRGKSVLYFCSVKCFCSMATVLHFGGLKEPSSHCHPRSPELISLAALAKKSSVYFCV